jgi:cell division protein FtsQ
MKKKKKSAKRNEAALIYYRSGQQERPPFPNPRIVLGLLIAAVVSYGIFRLAGHMIHDSNMFLLKEIRVQGNEYVERQDIVQLASLKPGKPLFQIPTKQVGEKVLQNPYLRGVSINRSLPSTLIISVQERQAVAYLVDQKIYMVDEEGKMLLKKPGMLLNHLPLITGLSVNSLLQNRHPLLRALELIKVIHAVDEDLFQFISEIHIERNMPPRLILIRGGAEVNIGSDHLHRRLYILSEFVKDSEVLSKLESIKKIDLTYKDRLIVTRKS